MTTTATCIQAECPMGRDGRCLERITPVSSCPHYREAPPPAEAPAAVTPAPTAQPAAPPAVASGERLPLPSGQHLRVTETLSITTTVPTRVIILAGARDSGKTTLVAELYERLLLGAYAGFLFAGSRTLRGFEERCHLARVASQRTAKDTVRTRLEDGHVFVHLRLRQEDLREPTRDVLLADVSGEHYRLAAQSSQDCRQLDMVPSAHHFVLFLDGERLLRKEYRQLTITEGRMLLRRLLDEGMLGQRSLVDVVFSKLDILRAAPDEEGVKGLLGGIRKNFHDLFAPRLGRLSFFEIAARVPNKDSKVESGHGVAQLVSRWVRTSPDDVLVQAPLPSLRAGADVREMDRYLWRHEQRHGRERSPGADGARDGLA